jgi:hypothetical protein
MHALRNLKCLIVSIVLMTFLQACFRDKGDSERINFNEVSACFNPAKESYAQPEWLYQSCQEPADTLLQNLPYSYDEAIGKIKGMFDSVNQQAISTQAKNYIKAVICADFVYAAFSYHYYGDDAGFAADSILNQGWDTLALNQCYFIGNNNSKAIYCYDRSVFYLRLVKTLAGISGKIINKDKVHSFPVLNIADDRGNTLPYLIDPYDPFIILREGESILPVFDQNADLLPRHVYRTVRAFGETRLLVSKELIKSLSGWGLQEQYCSIPVFTKKLVDRYLQSHPLADSAVIEPPIFNSGFVMPNNTPYAYAIETKGRPEGEFFTMAHYRKYYGK